MFDARLLLQLLQWPLAGSQAQFQVLDLTRKACCLLDPGYLEDGISSRLQTPSEEALLWVPRPAQACLTGTQGRAFSGAAPRLRKALPHKVRLASSLLSR